MARKTKYIIYVSKDVMDDPAALFDAAFQRFTQKDMDYPDRKKFMYQFHRASTDANQLKVIDAWIQVRDAATFPFGKDDNADTTPTGGVPVDGLGGEGEGEARDGSDPSDGHGDAEDAGGGNIARDEDAV